MARVNALGIDELLADMEKAGKIPDATRKKMLDEGAKILEKEIVQQMLMYGIYDRGTTRRSIKRGVVKYSKGGYYVEVWPAGIRHKDYDHLAKTRNAEVAFIAEYGTSKIQARPFMSTAVKYAADEVQEAMMRILQGSDAK